MHSCSSQHNRHNSNASQEHPCAGDFFLLATISQQERDVRLQPPGPYPYMTPSTPTCHFRVTCGYGPGSCILTQIHVTFQAGMVHSYETLHAGCEQYESCAPTKSLRGYTQLESCSPTGICSIRRFNIQNVFMPSLYRCAGVCPELHLIPETHLLNSNIAMSSWSSTKLAV